ncbi:MAG: helix-turn-helix domain-containing protein [Steroidobacteraceae bacterium]
MSAESESPAARAGVGARLKDARERAGLAPIEAAESLHIDTAALLALEADRFAEVGAPVFVRGYIRHYADLLGEPVEPLEALYRASAHAARVPDLTHIAKAASPSAAGALVRVGVVLVILAALVGAGWWIAGSAKGWRRPIRGGIVSALPPAPLAAPRAASHAAPATPATAAASGTSGTPGTPAAGEKPPISQASSASPDGLNPQR